MTDICEEFVRDIKKQFKFLFEEGRFNIAHVEPMGRERCLVVLDCGQFRVKIYRTLDEVNVQLGSPSAPLIWGEKADGMTQWHYLKDIVAFLRGQIEVNLPKKGWWAEQSRERQMAELSRDMLEHYAGIERLFSKGELETKREEYARFLELLDHETMRQYRVMATREATDTAE